MFGVDRNWSDQKQLDRARVDANRTNKLPKLKKVAKILNISKLNDRLKWFEKNDSKSQEELSLVNKTEELSLFLNFEKFSLEILIANRIAFSAAP